MSVDPVAGILLTPLFGAAILAVLPGYRIGAVVNVIASLAAQLFGLTLLWVSALLTLYTGWDYFRSGIHHLVEED